MGGGRLGLSLHGSFTRSEQGLLKGTQEVRALGVSGFRALGFQKVLGLRIDGSSIWEMAYQSAGSTRSKQKSSKISIQVPGFSLSYP